MIDQLVYYIETRKPEELLILGGYVVAGILFISIMLYIWFDTAPEEKKNEPTIADHQAEDDFASFQRMLMGKNAHTGETTRYSFMQNEQDVDVFVPVHHSTSKSSIVVKVTTNHVKVTINGIVTLDDELYQNVVVRTMLIHDIVRILLRLSHSFFFPLLLLFANLTYPIARHPSYSV